jgi:iron-sulfur cluster repair protein YtfE (RIC family)
MPAIGDFMQADHRHCDELLHQAEALAAAERWDDAAAGLQRFAQALELHLAREEEILFPTIEYAGGGVPGPTRMMRMEHEDMRELLVQMEGMVRCRDLERFLRPADALAILMRQHSLKEERVLYPMAERLLGDGAQTVRAMERLAEPAVPSRDLQSR